MVSVVPNSLRTLRPVDPRVVIQHHDIDIGLHGLIALVLDVAAIINAMHAGTARSPRVIASAIPTASLSHGVRRIPHDKHETFGMIHSLFQRALYAAGQAGIARLL